MENFENPPTWAVCGICFEHFTEEGDLCPHVLPCGHTFCAKDITQLAAANSQFLRCPICKSNSDRFPPKNFVAIEALAKSSSSSAFICSECGTNHATKFCPDCHKSFCEECNNIVHRLRILASHTPGPISSKSLFPLICIVHEEKMKLFCSNEQCRVPVCVLCASHGKHKGHTTCLLHEKVEEERQILDHNLKAYHSKINEMQELQEACSLSIASLLEVHPKISAKIHADFETAITSLELKRDALVSELQNHVNTRVAKLKDCLAQVSIVLCESALIQERTTQALAAEGSHFMGQLKEATGLVAEGLDQANVCMRTASSLQISGVIECAISQQYETVLASINKITYHFGSECVLRALKWDVSRKTSNGTLLDDDRTILRDGSPRAWTCAVIGTESWDNFSVQVQEMTQADWMVGFADRSAFHPLNNALYSTHRVWLFFFFYTLEGAVRFFHDGTHDNIHNLSPHTLPGDCITVSKKGATFTCQKNGEVELKSIELTGVLDSALYPVVMLSSPNSKVTLINGTKMN